MSFSAHGRGFRCEECDSNFDDIHKLGQHQLSKHSPGHGCSSCSSRFPDLHSLKKHRSSTHASSSREGEWSLLSSEQDRFPITRHNHDEDNNKLERTLGYVPFHQCEHCNKKFQNQYGLNQHLNLFLHDSKDNCHTCGSKFPNKSVLSLRLSTGNSSTRQLNGDRPNTEVYNRDASDRGASDYLHSTTYKKNTKIACTRCNKSFNSKSALDDHTAAIHFPKFYCRECDKRFSDQYALNQHLVSPVHPVIPYCDKCKRGFSTVVGLVQHRLSVHTSEFTYWDHHGHTSTKRSSVQEKKSPTYTSSTMHASRAEYSESIRSIQTGEQLMQVYRASRGMERERSLQIYRVAMED